MSIRFASYLMVAIVALVVLEVLADRVDSMTSVVGTVLLTTAVALGVMYGTEWLARVVHRRRRAADSA